MLKRMLAWWFILLVVCGLGACLYGCSLQIHYHTHREVVAGEDQSLAETAEQLLDQLQEGETGG